MSASSHDLSTELISFGDELLESTPTDSEIPVMLPDRNQACNSINRRASLNARTARPRSRARRKLGALSVLPASTPPRMRNIRSQTPINSNRPRTPANVDLRQGLLSPTSLPENYATSVGHLVTADDGDLSYDDKTPGFVLCPIADDPCARAETYMGAEAAPRRSSLQERSGASPVHRAGSHDGPLSAPIAKGIPLPSNAMQPIVSSAPPMPVPQLARELVRNQRRVKTTPMRLSKAPRPKNYEKVMAASIAFAAAILMITVGVAALS